MKLLSILALLTSLTVAHADPQLTSWFTANSGKYARIYQTAAAESAPTPTTSTTWSRGQGTVSSPTYADVNEVNYSPNWVYIRSTGLASHIMGPWYLDAAKSQDFPNFPANTATATSVYRIPRGPSIPTTKVNTGLGASGIMVNGVSMFDSRDAFSYRNASTTDATPVNGLTGDGIWNRDGWHNEGVTFDAALAHQAGKNYHYHAHPIALRYQLGDHVDYTPSTNRYTESTAAVTTHSPIVAWAADGLPVYGPYGYSSPLNASSGVRRMISGFTLRNGTNGTTAITVRQVLPLWAQRIQSKPTLTATQYGPAVSATYLLGHYIEDFDYRGDLGQTLGVDFDLNEQNVRFCYTPEFPTGTWAYFTPINADGTPQYPYTTGRQYYGTPSGGASTVATMNADTPLTQQFLGGANAALTIPNTPTVSGGTVYLTWSAVEGGTYSVEASPNQSTWTSKLTGQVSTGISKDGSYAAIGTTSTEYARVNRTALATYDATGQTAATVAQSTIKSYSLTPNTPPTISSVANQSIAMNSATSALAITVGDTETAEASLTMSGSSSNVALVPNANIAFGGSGSSRTVTVTPALSQTGTVTITLGVDDGATTTSTTFLLTVTGTNTSPTITAIGNQSTNQNTATSAIAFTVGDAEISPASLTLSGSSSNVTLVPNTNIGFGGSGASRTVTVTPASNQLGTATITVTVSDGAATANRSFTLTVISTAPTISNITNTPATPTSANTVTVTAAVAPSAGRTISSVQLTSNTGAGGTTTVFNETMSSVAAAAPWAGTNANNAWTVTNPVGAGGPAPPSPFSQTAAANRTPVGSGNQFGLEAVGGPPFANIGDGSVANATNINATGTSGNVQFYLAAVNQTATTGWNFQLSANGGTTWTTRLTESNTPRATHALFTYNLAATELVSTLRMRFQFAGGGPGGTGTFRVDDIKVATTSNSAPAAVAMLDNGLSGDGAAGDGVYGVVLPAQATGTTVTYTIAATDSAATATTSASNSYTVVAAAPVLAVTPATGLTSSGPQGGGFTPALASYTLTNTGNASMSWTATKTAAWLTLSAPSGTLAAGATANVDASINTSANSLTPGVYPDTVTFTNSTNGNGNATRAVSLTINSTTAPAAPVLAALTSYSMGSTKTISWPAAAGATSYTVQISTVGNFSSILSSQTVTGLSVSFPSLSNGVTYYYRVLATNNIGSSAYSNVVSSTQDTALPNVAITSPASGISTATNTVIVNGTSADAQSGISAVTVNGAPVTTSNNYATWTITVPLGFGSNALTAVALDGAGNAATSPIVMVTLTAAQTYNPLIIPEIMTGTNFNLNLHQTTKQFLSGAATNTYSYNNMQFWGPTLIMNKGDWVQLNVTNNLLDTTTTHWHGFHIPAIMDGGPHQTIPAGTTWSPSFKVDNNAGTYWYHPHLHEFTQKQLSYGAGGLIIIRDPEESALNLPRTYGVDDIPLALTSRRFTGNQIVATGSEYGDQMVVNGTLSPQVTLPKQYVRIRMLNAEMERSYNLGVTTSTGADRTFYLITTDGGLVNAPIALTRLTLAVGERAEILLDLTGETVGATFDVKAYNSGQANDFPGGEPATAGQFGSLLNNTTFNILHVVVGATMANPVTTRPTTLKTNTFWTDGQQTNTRTLTITNGFPGGLPFSFDNQVYSPTLFNQTVNLNAIEKWNITNTSGFSHSFHIHDIQFNLISRTGGNNAGLKAFEAGWKDVLFIGQNQTVSFITKFDHFASNTNPFMYHCHFPSHEDAGLMGQFIVKNNAVEDLAIASFTRTGTSNQILLNFKATPGTTYSLMYSSDLTTSSWKEVGSVTSDGTSATFTETDPTRLGQSRGFYRVTVPAITQ